MESYMPGRRARHRLLSALLVVMAGMLPNCSTPAPTPPAPICIQSTPWHVGAAVKLTLHTTPPRAGESLTLTLLAPGSGQSQVIGRAPEFFGLSGVQLLWLPPEYRETESALAAAAGARYVGLDFDWRHIEPEPGQYDWTETDDVVALARRYNLRLVPMLLYTPRWVSTAPFAPLDYHRAPPADFNDYREFVYAVVDRYKPYGTSPPTSDGYGISDWVIWNEPNVHSYGEAPNPGDFWTGSLEEYLRLLRAGYEGAHAADPGCNVLNGALADVFWAEGELDLITALERLYDPDGDGDASDGGRQFFDTLNVHTYQPGAPEAIWYEGRLEATLQVMERFGDGQKPLWITETGYGSVGPPSVPPASRGEESAADSPYVDEKTQADAVRVIYKACSAYPPVERVFWWSLRDYHSDASATNTAMEAHYGLLRANFTPKPAYLSYARLTGSVGQVLTLNAMTDDEGVAQMIVPASFVARPGTYVAFANLALSAAKGLDETSLTAVATYEASPGEEGGQD